MIFLMCRANLFCEHRLEAQVKVFFKITGLESHPIEHQRLLY